MKTTALVTAIAAASVASAIPSTPHGEVQERDADPLGDYGHVEGRDAGPDAEAETEPLVDGYEGTTLVERDGPGRNETAPGPPTSGGVSFALGLGGPADALVCSASFFSVPHGSRASWLLRPRSLAETRQFD